MGGRSSSKQATTSTSKVTNQNLQAVTGTGAGIGNTITMGDYGAIDAAGRAVDASLSAIETVALDSNAVVRFAMSEQTDLMRDVTGGAFNIVDESLQFAENSSANAMKFADDFSRAENPDFYKYMAIAGVAGAAVIAWGLKK